MLIGMNCWPCFFVQNQLKTGLIYRVFNAFQAKVKKVRLCILKSIRQSISKIYSNKFVNKVKFRRSLSKLQNQPDARSTSQFSNIRLKYSLKQKLCIFLYILSISVTLNGT